MGLVAAGLAACTSAPEAAQPAGQQGPGVTADAVNVGFIAVDIGELSQQLGFVNVEDGGYPNVSKGIQAIVNYINANGGLGGRQMNATIKPYDATQDSPEYAESVCKSFTQDAQVFIMGFDGQFQNSARPCYRAGRAIMLDQTLVAHDQAEFEEYAPYLWTVSNPEFNGFLTTQLNTLRDAGWFNGSTGVAVVYPDTEVTRRAAQTVVNPYLTQLGVTNSKEFAIDSSNAGSLGATATLALTGAQAAGLDRVFVVGGARIMALMLAQAEAETLQAKYSVSTYDSPAFFVDNPDTIVAERRSGMAGVGFQGGGDMRLGSGGVPFPDPANPQEVLCKQIIDQAGATPPAQNRENYRVVFQHCDTAFLMKAAFDKMPKDDISAEAFRNAVWSLGDSWRGALDYAPGWVNGSYAGAKVGRGFFWDDNCQLPDREPGCFRYGTGDLPFTTPPVAAAVPATTAGAPPA
jgi:hypothetical protein